MSEILFFEVQQKINELLTKKGELKTESLFMLKHILDFLISEDLSEESDPVFCLFLGWYITTNFQKSNYQKIDK